MAVYYSIEAEGKNIDEKFENEESVCRYIRSKGLANYKVFERDDTCVKAQKIENAIIFPMLPMKDDITERIKGKLASTLKVQTD